MPTVYNKDGEAVLCDNEQVEAMVEGGWSLSPPEQKTVVNSGSDAGGDDKKESGDAKGKGK
jgi:hypothetical protein